MDPARARIPDEPLRHGRSAVGARPPGRLAGDRLDRFRGHGGVCIAEFVRGFAGTQDFRRPRERDGAVSAALQTFLRYAERAEKHRAAGARYGAVRRRLEAIFAGDADARDGHYLTAIRDELDRLAEDSPNVPPRVFYRTQRTLSAGPQRNRDD